MAFAIVLGMLFCLTNIEAAIEASETIYYPFLEIFYASVNSRAGACVMASLVLMLAIVSTVGIYASASRMVWSFARDKGLPFSGHLVKVRLNLLHYFPFCRKGITNMLTKDYIAYAKLLARCRSYGHSSNHGSVVTDCAWIRHCSECACLVGFRSSLFFVSIDMWFASMASLYRRIRTLLGRWTRAVF